MGIVIFRKLKNWTKSSTMLVLHDLQEALSSSPTSFLQVVFSGPKTPGSSELNMNKKTFYPASQNNLDL